jgi:cell division protease FtsH
MNGPVNAPMNGPMNGPMNRTVPLDQLPLDLRVEDAVDAACARDIAFIEERLLAGQSVLVECDKELVLHLTLALRARLKRVVPPAGGRPPRLVIVDGRGGADDPPAGSLTRMINQLGNAVRGAAERSVVVLPHLDVLTTTHTGLTLEAREAVPLLYENPDVCLLGFRDPSFEIPKVLRGVFAARREITGIPREALPQLITQREARAISTHAFDPFALYTFVSGQNPVRCRRLFADLARRLEAPPDRSAAPAVYAELRRQTTVDDIELPQIDLDRDVGGYAEVKRRLREDLIDLVQRKDVLTTESDIKALEDLLPRGVIFHGPPGTGKTHFAKAVAAAMNATALVVSGPELKSKWVGESEENLRRVFRRARQSAPAVIVFDEIDAFATARGTYQGSGVEHSMVNQLLTEMDGFRRNEMVFVIGTTNLLSAVDPALLRPGRFEFLIDIPAPEAHDRAAIVELYSRRLDLGLNEELVAHLVRRTEDWADRARGLPYAGDHLAAVCRALKRQQLRTGRGTFSVDDIDRALQRRALRPVVLSTHEERVIAVHESGHALLAMLVPGARPPEKIALAQDRDGALGYVLRAAHIRPYATTTADMRAEICVGLGGLEAERLVLADVSIGAHGDLQQCTRIARAMVESHGMVASLGPRVLLDDGDRIGDQWSEQRRARVDDAVDGLLEEERRRAAQLLMDHRALLDELVGLLLERRVLDGAALAALRPGRAVVTVTR